MSGAKNPPEVRRGRTTRGSFGQGVSFMNFEFYDSKFFFLKKGVRSYFDQENKKKNEIFQVLKYFLDWRRDIGWFHWFRKSTKSSSPKICQKRI